ncbi:MAG: domain containing protein [Gemmatimonadetes bacterium]|nr:domain containing protein [Gemmatimonadota bacterium]
MAWMAFGALTRELHDGEIVVGSGADADWRVPTADLMPRHFVVVVHGLNASVKPSSPDVVVVLNGKQLGGPSGLLNDGDVISAGRGRFTFSEETPRVLPADSPSGDDAYLVEDEARVAHPLNNRSTTLGRDASNTIVVRDPTASRFHAEIRREAGGFALHSMGSSGTSVNGSLMKGPCLLGEGDTVEIAHTKLRFTREKPAADVQMALLHSPNNDDAGRRATMVSHRVRVEPDNMAERGSDRLRLVMGVAAVVVLAFAAWLIWR